MAAAAAAYSGPLREGARRQDGSRPAHSYRESPARFVRSDGRCAEDDDDVEAQEAYRERYYAQQYGRRGGRAAPDERRANARYAIDEAEEEGESPYWHVPFEWGFSILCVYGCLSYLALISGVPAALVPQ